MFIGAPQGEASITSQPQLPAQIQSGEQHRQGPHEAALWGMVEAAGIEPASANDPDPVLHA